MQRFRRHDLAGYTMCAGHLEGAARIAARGELGYSVNLTAVDGVLTVSLVARLLATDGRVHTQISHEARFEDTDSQIALVQANENATELRAMAEELNDQWLSALDAQACERQSDYERLDTQALASTELRRMVEAEGT